MSFFYQAHATPCKEQTNIYDPLYNNGDYVRNTKSCFSSIEPNKKQSQKQDI